MLKLSTKTALGLFNLDHFELVRCKEANVKCIVAWSSETLLVAFRGTANLTNMFADVRVGCTVYSPRRHHCRGTTNTRKRSHVNLVAAMGIPELCTTCMQLSGLR